MKIQLIRNATLRLAYNQHWILIDPMFSPKFQFRSFAGISENPTVDLPFGVGAILKDIEAVFVSHLHPDHFDELAQETIPKGIPLFTQLPSADAIQTMGFEAVHALAETHVWHGIEMTPTPGEHGFGDWVERMGPVTGLLLRAPGEPTLYWVGDSVLYPEVEAVIEREQPDVIVTHSGGATFGAPESTILMDAAATLRLAQLAPNATLVAVHMESLDHCPVTRQELRDGAEAAGISERVLIPSDGEMIEINV